MQSKLPPPIQDEMRTLFQSKRKNYLIEYLRDKNRQKVGVLIARQLVDNENNPLYNTIEVQLSKCHFFDRYGDPLDTFDKYLGLHIAHERCRFGSLTRSQFLKLPIFYRPQVAGFISRAIRYFVKAGFDVTHLEQIIC